MPEFGIYFGSRAINITGVNKREALVNISVPRIKITDSGTEQKITDEAKIVAALKDEFQKNEISPGNASLALSGDDVIIRTFDLPIFLSKKELEYKSIAFEAKKYIPFKIDDLVFDFQLYPDRKEKKNLVLFVGIKKDMLNRYLSIFKQLQVHIRLIEYAGFSILRFLRLAGLRDKGILGVLNVDLQEETNFLACQSGFPLFSRDITLISKSNTETEANLMDNLKSEMRISLDFFRRKFRTKSLDKIIVLTPPKLHPEIATLTKDLGISMVPLEVSEFWGKDIEFKSSYTKSYATAISNVGGLRYPINLIKPAVKKGEAQELSILGLPVSITAIRINLRVALLACLIIFLSWGWGRYRLSPIENELKSVSQSQPKIEGISGAQSSEKLKKLEEEYINKINIMEGVVKNRFYLAKAMDIIPRLMPSGAWLVSLSFEAKDEGLEFSFDGKVYLGDSDKEFAAVNDIVLGLRNNPEFTRMFKEINVASIEKTELEQTDSEATKFVILCH